MATKLLGTTNDHSLTALAMSGAMVPADMASVAQGVKNDQVNGLPIWPGAWSQNGLLHVPNRGVLKVLPGDYVAIDNEGWPILVSAYSIANGHWVVT